MYLSTGKHLRGSIRSSACCERNAQRFSTWKADRNGGRFITGAFWRDEGRAPFFLNELAGAIVQAENWQA